MHFLTLRITGKNLPIQEIQSTIGKEPSTIYYAGESKKTLVGVVTHEEDGIFFHEEILPETCLDEAISRFVHACFRNKLKLAKCAKDYKVLLYLSVYPETVQMHIPLCVETMRLLSECGVELLVSVMSLQDYYEGEYGKTTL